MADLG